MKIAHAKAFLRPMSKDQDAREDGSAINLHAAKFVVTDGDSAAYSPDTPALLYDGEFTGGQIASRELCSAVLYASRKTDISEDIMKANFQVLLKHRTLGRDPGQGHDVGGASFAACQVKENRLDFYLAGDSWVWLQVRKTANHTLKDVFFFNGFDAASYRVEKEDLGAFAAWKEKANGSTGVAWNLYRPHYEQKRIRCANKNLGTGGHATLNGGLKKDILTYRFVDNCVPEILLLGTDGLLPFSETHPDLYPQMARQLERLYLNGGVDRVLAWRDAFEKAQENEAHIDGYPEGTLIEVKFK